MSPANIVRAANRRIRDFVHNDANRRNLVPATGCDSTPFRGSLFGEAESDPVAKQLPRLGVDVLWLGTNPYVPRSLENTVRPPRGHGRLSTIRWNPASLVPGCGITVGIAHPVGIPSSGPSVIGMCIETGSRRSLGSNAWR